MLENKLNLTSTRIIQLVTKINKLACFIDTLIISKLIFRLHKKNLMLIQVLCSVFLMQAILLYMGSPFIIPLLDTFFPLENGSYPLLVPSRVDYLFFNQFDYFYPTCCYLFIICFYINMMFAGTETIYFCCVQHISGLFAIVR